MKNYEAALQFEGYRKHTRTLYSSFQFEDLLGNDILFYNKFIKSGFTDWYTYYSMFVHEFYLMTKDGDVKCFVWRNAGPYRVEFKTEKAAIECLRVIDSVPTKQVDPLTIEFKHMSTDVIEVIGSICLFIE